MQKLIHSVGRPARYVRDWLTNNNLPNAGRHWVELQAFSGGVNVAQGKPISNAPGFTMQDQNGAAHAGGNIVDGAPASNVWARLIPENNVAAWIQIDLGAQYILDELKIWHYYTDGRSYNGTKTEISTDGV